MKKKRRARSYDHPGYYTTIEASKMLRISVSTVQRYFDDHKLSGDKNAITKWRLISRASLLELAEKYGLII